MTLKEKENYWKLKEEALHSTLWRTRSARSCGPTVRQTVQRMNIFDTVRSSSFAMSNNSFHNNAFLFKQRSKNSSLIIAPNVYDLHVARLRHSFRERTWISATFVASGLHVALIMASSNNLTNSTRV